MKERIFSCWIWIKYSGVTLHRQLHCVTVLLQGIGACCGAVYKSLCQTILSVTLKITELFMALCMAVWSTCKNCYCVNCPQFRPYASVHYGGKYSQKKSLTVEWILMLTQKQRPVISAGIKSKGGQWVCESLRGTIYSNLCASPTWKWASKELRITGKRAVKAHVGPSTRSNFITSKIIDHQLPKYGPFTKLHVVWTWGFESTAFQF